jgi:hypothetical protein
MVVLHEKLSKRVILSEAKLQRSPENIRDEARLSISDYLWSGS